MSKPRRSNCLIGAFWIWRRFGGRLVIVRGPRWHSWFPHFGIRIPSGDVLDYYSPPLAAGQAPPGNDCGYLAFYGRVGRVPRRQGRSATGSKPAEAGVPEREDPDAP